MAKGNDKAADGRALWDRARWSTLDALAARAPDIDETDLAAYLDGGLDEAARARVEAALASRPDSLELLIAAREALAAGSVAAPVAAPAALVARAQALAPARAAPMPAGAGRSIAGYFARLAALPGLAFAGVAAGFLVISAAGFELGRAEVMYSSQVDSLLAQEFAALIGRDGEDLL